MTTIYLIENGDLFEGTLEQFQDCFFSNGDDETIREWAAEHGWTVTTREEERPLGKV